MRVSVILALAVTSMAPMMMAKEDVDQRLSAAADVLSDMMHASDKGIPQDLINKAQCVVIVPGLKKGAFIIGAKYGKGFAACRRAGGMGWTGACRRSAWKVVAWVASQIGAVRSRT